MNGFLTALSFAAIMASGQMIYTALGRGDNAAAILGVVFLALNSMNFTHHVGK